MPAKNRDFRRDGPAIAPDDTQPDNGAAAQQRVIRTPAGAPVSVPNGAAPSVFALAKAPAADKSPSTNRGGFRKTLPALDPASLVFEPNIPKPPRRLAKPGSSKYDALFDGLAVGYSNRQPIAYFTALVAAAKKRMKEGKKGTFTVRRINDTHCRIWRDA
jgi:hypothetical protein